METAHAAPGDDKGFIVVMPDFWNEFIDNVMKPPLMKFDAAMVVALDVRPRLAVDAVDAYQTYQFTVDIT